MVAFVSVLFPIFLQQLFWRNGLSSQINLEECRPPDYPEFGDYSPKRETYLPGDVIHYSCDPDYYIGGNYRRVCFDNGDWSGDTPVCDGGAIFAHVEQSSTAQPEHSNDALRANDGDRTTCSKTLRETSGATWTGIFQDHAREVLRFMLYLPKGQMSYEVFIIKSDGTEVSCGRSTATVVMYDWVFHNCLQPNNTDAVGVVIKSLTRYPLELCEVVVHTLSDPTCSDPHFHVDSGRLMLTRKTAKLKCDEGFIAYDGDAKKLDCIRTGVWSRRKLFCEDIKFTVGEAVREPSDKEVEDDEGPLRPGQRPPLRPDERISAEREG